MKEIFKENLETTIKEHYQVIVCGAGPAGIGSAIASARQGMKTLLIDKNGYAGGMWTAGLVNPIFDYRLKKGIIRELIHDLDKSNCWGGFADSCFNYNEMKYLLDQKIAESGVTPLFHTYLCGVTKIDNRVTGVITQNKDGRCGYTADVVIDCTGDGDAAVSAGAEYFIGRPQDGKTQPMTTMFILGNIQFKQDKPHELYEIMSNALANDISGYQIPFKRPFIIQLPGKNQAVVQLTHIHNVSGINAAELSRAEMEGRRQVMEAVAFFRGCIPQLANAELLYIAPQIGVRETRRIVGEYILTKEDVVEGRKFEDGITEADFGIDIHNPEDSGQTVVQAKSYQIPYRCLIPRSIENLLVAGRCISGTFEAHAFYRVTGTCCALGEAAGIAAAISVTNHRNLRDIHTSKILENIGVNPQ